MILSLRPRSSFAQTSHLLILVPPKRQASSHQILFFIISAHTPVAPSPLSFSAIMQKYIPLVAHRPKNVTSSIVRSPEEERRKPGPWKVRGWADP